MNAVIYARYSSDNQREESIEGQLRECREFAEKNDIQVIDVYTDRAFSAKTDNRPDFQRMIKDSAGKKFEVVIVWKLDRFARNRYDSAHYKSVLKKNGVKVISATETISQGAEGILLETMLEGMAEYYSAELAEKVTRGMTENALKCKYNGGTLPIGYVIDENQRFRLDPIEAPMVLKAFTDYANGASMKTVVDMLNMAGIHTKASPKLTLNSVARMFHNRRYIGEYKFRDVVIPNGIPAIVPEELFYRVQDRMEAVKKAPAKLKAEDEYLLTTKLFCGKCKCFMTGESGTSHTGDVHRYYKCVSARKHECDKKTVHKKWIEDLVINEIKGLLFNDELIEKLTDLVMEKQSAENVLLPAMRKTLEETEKAIANLLNAIQMGIITESTKDRLTQLEQQKKEIELRITKEEIAHPTVTKEQIRFVFEKLRKLDLTKLEHRRKLIDIFVNAIYLYDDKILLTFNYKDGTKTIVLTDLGEISGEGSDLSASGAPSKMPEIVRFRAFF